MAAGAVFAGVSKQYATPAAADAHAEQQCEVVYYGSETVVKEAKNNVEQPDKLGGSAARIRDDSDRPDRRRICIREHFSHRYSLAGSLAGSMRDHVRLAICAPTKTIIAKAFIRLQPPPR